MFFEVPKKFFPPSFIPFQFTSVDEHSTLPPHIDPKLHRVNVEEVPKTLEQQARDQRGDAEVNFLNKKNLRNNKILKNQLKNKTKFPENSFALQKHCLQFENWVFQIWNL